MNCRNKVITLSEIGKLSRLLEPCSLEQRIKSVLSTAVNDTWTDNEYFNVLSFEGKDFILNFFDELILGKRDSWLVIEIFPKCVFNRLLLDCIFLIFKLFFLFTTLIAFFWFLFVLNFRLLFFLLFRLTAFLGILFIYRRWWILFDFPIAVAPYHNVTDEDKSFVIFKI